MRRCWGTMNHILKCSKKLGRIVIREHGVMGLWGRLQNVSRRMQRWSREVFGSVKGELKNLRQQLMEAKQDSLVFNNNAEIKAIEARLYELLEREEIM